MKIRQKRKKRSQKYNNINRGVLKIICSAAARKLKSDMLPGSLIELLYEVFLFIFNGSFGISRKEAEFPCRTYQNSTRKP